jgi:hypothetical protein
VFTPDAVDTDDIRCGLCRRLEPPFVKATAYGSYHGGLRELIHLLKYGLWLSRGRSQAVKSCWWMMFLPPALPRRSAPGFGCAPAHLKYL